MSDLLTRRPVLPCSPRRLDVRNAIGRRRFLGAGAAFVGGAALAGCASRQAQPVAAPAATGPGVVVDLGDSLFDLALLGIPVAGNIYGASYVGPVLDLLGVDPAVRDRVVAGPTVTTEGGFEANIEAIAALAPDLVLTTANFEMLLNGTLDDVRALGVRVEVLDDDIPWQDRSRALGAIVGRSADIERRIIEIEQRRDALAERVTGAGVGGSVVSLMRPFEDQLLAFVPPSLPSELTAALGLTQPASQLTTAKADPFPGYAAQAFLSAELLGGQDGDVLVVAVADLTPQTTADPLSAFGPGLPTGTLGAVQQGRVVGVPYFLWALNSAAGAGQIVADLDRVVTALTS